MLQKRGWLTSVNAVLWPLNFSNGLPKGAVTLSNSKGGFWGAGQRGPFSLKLFCIIFIEFSNNKTFLYSWQVGKCPSHPLLNFLDPPLAGAGKMSS